jgi:zinc D-Ala-D-Ala carboxypeptidase
MKYNHTGLKDCIHCKNRKINCLETLMGRMRLNPLTEEMQNNLEDLLVKVNKFREKYGKPMVISSGYRPAVENEAAGGAKLSAHKTCQAIDFGDKDKQLKEFVKKDPKVLEECDLYMEAAEDTPTWIHLQNRKTKSGNRIFKP